MEISFLFSFLAGLVSVASPCVLPLIPLVIGHSIIRRRLGETLSFFLGFFMIFTIITLLTLLFTAAINVYLFYFRIIAATLLIIIGIYILFNYKMINFSYKTKYDDGLLGSFFMGFIGCLAWSPCFGPYIVAIATYSVSAGNIWFSLINMLFFTIGFSLTILLFALLASKIDLSKVIEYSDGIRIFSGMIILIAGIYMLITLWGLL